jgi:hypothetical protein
VVFSGTADEVQRDESLVTQHLGVF